MITMNTEMEETQVNANEVPPPTGAMSTASAPPNDPKLAEALAIRDESFVRIAIMREQHRLAQLREDAYAQARIDVLLEESQQRKSYVTEAHEAIMKAWNQEKEIRLETEKIEREKLKREGDLREANLEGQATETWRRQRTGTGTEVNGESGEEERRGEGFEGEIRHAGERQGQEKPLGKNNPRWLSMKASSGIGFIS
jgi:hypothetical protein